MSKTLAGNCDPSTQGKVKAKDMYTQTHTYINTHTQKELGESYQHMFMFLKSQDWE